ncbi:MAG: hypothetical protein ACJ77C_14470 [Chloroflexota bacterium]
MIVITLISLALAFALVVGLALSLDRAGIATTSPGVIGIPFVAPDAPARARGVQEEDLPRFVFRDRPWARPEDAPAPRAPLGRVPKLALG